VPAETATTEPGEDAGFARAVAVERRAHEQVAARVTRLRCGHAFVDETLPLVFFANLLWVTAQAGEVSAAELVDDADRALAAFAHRWLVVEHEPLWRTLDDDFAAAGWGSETHVYMTHRRAPDRMTPGLESVREVAREDILAAEQRFMQTQPWCAGEAGRQVIEHQHHLGDVLGERYFAAFDGDAVCGYAKLRGRDGVAQVEDVVVLPEARGAGRGRLVTTAALVAGIELEPELLFIVADDGDWPKVLYARLGFEAVGRTRMYHRLPA
jgi:GNAT superfamily N-acetyltransferase